VSHPVGQPAAAAEHDLLTCDLRNTWFYYSASALFTMQIAAIATAILSVCPSVREHIGTKIGDLE